MEKHSGTKQRYLGILLIFILAACSPLDQEPQTTKFLNDSFSVIKPAGWSIMNSLNDQADLQMGNIFREGYAVILSENKVDFDGISLEAHSELTRSAIKKGLSNYQESGPEEIKAGDFPAIRYQLTGNIDGVKIIYWHVTIESDNHFHQLLLWSLPSRFDSNKSDFNSVVNSFKAIQ